MQERNIFSIKKHHIASTARIKQTKTVMMPLFLWYEDEMVSITGYNTGIASGVLLLQVVKAVVVTWILYNEADPEKSSKLWAECLPEDTIIERFQNRSTIPTRGGKFQPKQMEVTKERLFFKHERICS